MSPSFIFTWTAVTNNAFEICQNASHCCARKFEIWRQYPESWEALTCEHKISDKLLANCHWIVNCQIQFYMNNKAIVLLIFFCIITSRFIFLISPYITKFNVVNSLNFDRVFEVSWYKNAPKAFILCPAFKYIHVCRIIMWSSSGYCIPMFWSKP